MSTHSKPADQVLRDSIIDNLATDAAPSPPSHNHLDAPLLSSYDRDELIARENSFAQRERHRSLEHAKLERKAIADLLVDQFELTGSDLPADANPRQLHLF